MNEIEITLAIGYLVAMSLTGFVLMGIDKRKAISGKWRIPERTLILIAIIGGGIGSFLGMQIFRHKTKKVKFKIILPLAALVYILIGTKLILL